MKKINTSLVLTLAFLILAGCATQKKKEDVGAVGKAYHNMTARYNGYYNASNLLLESRLALENQHRDNYNNILPIYKYVAADNPQAEAEQLDDAIKRVTVVVKLHEISHWTDDCYLLAGQAQYMKQDYELAEETLEYLVAEYSPQKMAERESIMKAKRNRKKAVKKGKASVIGEDGERVELTKKQRQKLAKKKRKAREKERKRRNREIKRMRKGKGKKSSRKKEEEKEEEVVENEDKRRDEVEEEKGPLAGIPLGPDGYPLPGTIRLGDTDVKIEDGDPEKYIIEHRPAYQEGVLWLARTYIERENYTNAERLLNKLERSSTTFNDIRREVAVAKAHYFLKQKRYDLAVEPLETAISMTDDNAMKARLSYILGQVHQEANRGQAAYAAFEQVLKNQPVYDMEFNARLNLALAGVNSVAESQKQLERMLRDEKNRDFQDQLYFALAEIELKNGNRNEAIAYLEEAAGSSSGNTSLQAEIYVMLADMHYEDEDFVKAKNYYASAASLLNPKDERFPRVNRLAGSLEGIAENIQIIELQDSLLAISRMTEEERRELAFRIRKEQNEKRLAEARAKAESANANKQRSAAPRTPGSTLNQSNFWAYDDRNVKKGVRDFQRKWGNRDLADNWRLSNQESLEPDEAIEAAVESPGALTDDDVAAIFKDVPDTPEELAAANRQIEAAMFTLGTLYRDRIENYEKAVETLKELLNRYPETQYKLDALYYLHLAYKDMGDETNAQYYYDQIVNGYPQTNYARMLKDPNFALQVASKENRLMAYYNETYAAFENRQYKNVVERISKVGEQFGATNSLQPRFALLNAMSLGNLEGKDKYIEELKEVIARYPEAPEAIRAREILRLLGERVGGGPGQLRNLPGEEGQVGVYKVQEDQLHYVIVVFENDINLNDAKVGVSEFNSKYYSMSKLRMNNIYLGTGQNKMPIVAIRRFKDKAEAMGYYDSVQKNKKDFLDENTFRYELLPINQDNYRELLKTKNIDDYRIFFDQNYRN